MPISTVQPGDHLLSFTSEGSIVRTQVRNVLRLEVNEHVVLTTDRETLRVTADHPFFVGGGTFKTLEALRTGDTIIAWDGQSLAPQQILAMETIPGRTPVYNLQTDYPHTFFVGHVAVHNKGGGGGGGCFPPGTPIATPCGEVPIESLAPGDAILSLTDQGLLVPTAVRSLLVARNELLEVKTRRGSLQATPDHPVGGVGGNFQPLGELHRGDRILRWASGRLTSDRVRRVSQGLSEALVFNLQVDAPHTFLASGIVVHNKGGSFGGSHSSSSSGGGGSSDDPLPGVIVILIILTVLVIMVILKRRARRSKSENLDFVYSPSVVARKADRTETLLQFLSRQDPSVASEALRKVAECHLPQAPGMLGEARLWPDGAAPDGFSLCPAHRPDSAGWSRNREINRIENLQVQKVDLVNVRYTEKPNQREFTALISASARDYYVEEATGKFIRGDKAAARFQEFWTFQRLDQRWLLREVEQAGESDYLKDENFARC